MKTKCCSYDITADKRDLSVSTEEEFDNAMNNVCIHGPVSDPGNINERECYACQETIKQKTLSTEDF